MDKARCKKIVTSVLAMLLIFSMFSETAFALSGDGSHIGHTGGGSSVSGAYLVPSSNADHHVGFRFSWLTLGTDGYYSRKSALDVYYNGYNPNSSWGYHIKATVNGTTYRNLSKYEYKRYFDSMTIDREYYSTSTAYKYCNRTDIPVVLPADEEAMTTWGKKEANMNIILNKMVSGATVANMKSSDFIFIEPIYRVKIENTNYCITVTEMGLIGCVVCSNTSTGNEGSGYGSGWVTIRRYTNLNWPDALKTDAVHAGISAGTTLSSATSFQNMVKKGYGLMVVWNTNPHLLTVYYTTGTGDSSLKISSSYKLASNFSSYSSSYIRNSANDYFTQGVYYDNNLTLMNGAGSGFNMTRDYYTFSKWQKDGTSQLFSGGTAYKASSLESTVSAGDKSVTLTAVWTPKEYTITYNLNGGKIGTSSTNPTQKYTYETDVYIGNYTAGATAYSVPTKSGYDFAGWKYTGTTTGYWTKDTTYANRYHKGKSEHGNITLTAQWTPKSYTVTYNANGGSGAPSSQTKSYNVDLTLSSTKPTRDGYNFTGWNTKSDGTGTAYASGGKYTKNESVTLYAQWSKKTYTVSYNANGGSGAPSAQTKTHGVDLTLSSSKPTRDGYNFTGWNTKSDGTGTAYASGGKYTKNESVTLYAQWSKKTYTVSYNANGGSGAPSAQTKTHGVDLTLSSTKPTRDGYNFTGWNTKSDGTGTAYASGGKYTKNESVTLYAQWTKKTYTVSYNANGGSGAPSAQTKTHGVDLTLSSTKPTRDGYNFTGWNTKSDGTGTAYASGGKYTKNESVTLYAQWTKKTYTVSYNANGGTGAPSAQTKTHGVDLTLSSTKPTRDGYNFTGWNTKSDGTGTAYASGGKYTKNESITLYAQWTKKTYTVSYNANGGTGAPSSQTKTHGVDLTLSSTKPTRDGYNFTGWNTKSDGTGTAYASGGKYTKNESVTLYAQWSKKTYTVSYNANGGTGAPSAQTKTHDVDLTLSSAKPTREGYDFTGWNTKADGKGTAYASGGKYTKNESVTLYAQWKLKTYTVSYNANGGSGAPSAQTKTHGVDLTLSSTKPTRDGFNFTGWNTKSDGTGTAYASGGKYTKNESVTLYAQWSKKTYTVSYNANGGTGAPSSQTKTHDVDLTLSSAKPTREGYDFTGWNTKADGKGTAYASGSKYTKNESVTLYAQWKLKTYTVSYNANGGSGAPSAQTKTHGVDLTLSSTKPTREGYVFASWNTKSDGKGTTYSSGGKYTGNASLLLYAIWTPINYEVKFNGNGSTSGSMRNQSFTYDVTQNLTANAFKRAFVVTYNYNGNGSKDSSATANAAFSGWATSATGSKAYNDKQFVKNLSSTQGATINLYAKWTDASVTLPSPARTGYTFNGWFTAASGGTRIGEGGAKYTPTKNITLYAQWSPITYTIKFVGNGSTSGTMANLTMTYDVAKNLTDNAFKRTGYSYIGWNTKADGGGTKYTNKQSVKNLTTTNGATITLYAQWTPDSYTIKFNGNNATSGSMSDLKMTYDVAKNLTANAFKKTGYTFKNWNTKADGTSTSYEDKQSVKNLPVSSGNTITLYAQWTPISYTIRFNGNGSTSGTMANLAMTYDIAKNLTANAFKKTGYVFSGWATTTTGKAEYSDKQSVKNLTTTNGETINLYAVWTPITYTIIFNGNNSTSGAMSNLSMTYDTAKALTANAFKRTGYTFNGWNTSTDGSGTKYTDKQIVKNLTTTQGATVNLYAQWNPIGYAVKFNGNGSTSGSMSNQAFVYDIAQNLTANAFTREFKITYNYNYSGKTNTTAKATAAFNGWATSSTGSVVYADKQSVKNLSSTAGAVINVYAKWSDAKTTLPTPTRTGYTFDGWYTTATGSTKIGGGGSSYTTDKDVTVYAHWTPITYTIKFDGNNATSGTMANMTMTYDVAKNLIANAYVRTGYTFSGWNTAADGKGTAYADKQSVKNLTATDKATITLYAQWKPISYTIRFNGNGAGSGSMSDLAMTYDVEKSLTANAFVKNAAEFIKWNTKADGTGTDYSDKQVVKNLTTENGKVITLYAQWKNVRELSLEAITPNASYRESTDVITSFNLVNKCDVVCLPTDNVSVIFKVYKDSTVIKTVTQTGVVVPGNEKNLLFFKWTVPTNLGSSKIYVSGEIVENGSSYGFIKNQYTTCKYNVYATPDTQYEASAPDGFTVPGAPTAKSDTAKWSVWTYENNAFKKLNYGMAISDAAATITPDESANAEQKNGGWVMKSGYGYGITLNNGIKTLSGYSAAPSAAYTNSQYALALFPEFGYAQTNNNCRTLELISGKWSFRENSNYGRIHFTPLWYPDGNYTAAVLQSDCWTPAGMISRMSNTNTITISGSAYDDWYVG